MGINRRRKIQEQHEKNLPTTQSLRWLESGIHDVVDVEAFATTPRPLSSQQPEPNESNSFQTFERTKKFMMIQLDTEHGDTAWDMNFIDLRYIDQWSMC